MGVSQSKTEVVVSRFLSDERARFTHTQVARPGQPLSEAIISDGLLFHSRSVRGSRGLGARADARIVVVVSSWNQGTAFHARTHSQTSSHANRLVIIIINQQRVFME